MRKVGYNISNFIKVAPSEVTLFKVLKNRWDELDLGDLQLPTIPAVYKDAVQVGLVY